MKRLILIGSFFTFSMAHAQEKLVPVGDNLVVQGIPAIPYSIAEEVKPYTESRGAGIQAWHPVLKQMLISTRFGNTNQFHQVKMPGGDRKQLTFFEEAPGGAIYQPITGNYFLFTKDVGGNEFAQIYRHDVATGKTTMLTNGSKAQNGNIVFNKKGNRIVYASTRRNGTDRDIYMMDPLNPSSDKLILEVKGGGWGIADWSDDEKYLLLGNFASINEASTWIYDIAAEKNTKLLPAGEERTVYQPAAFSNDGRYAYILTNKGSEFRHPVQIDVKTGKMSDLTKNINWEITGFNMTDDGNKASFLVNEAGVSKLYIMYMATKAYKPVPIPVGVVGNTRWHKDGKSLAFTFINSSANSDVFEWNTTTGKLTRWTESELGGMNLSGIDAPALIKWKSFDGQEITGFKYAANKKFTGKRPVIIDIHGGPEGQSTPVFLGRYNYMMNELGVTMLFPNVRGSTGFGKTFTDMDNGFKREESVKDIGALLDWIATQPDLDASRIMVTGGSYGGYMTLAVAFHYNDRIRCALDVVGISHFGTFLKNTESYRRDLRRVEYGDERDPAMAAFFEKISPLNNAEKIKKPMFIVQGKNDPRVPYTEAQQMVDKIKGNGGVVWYLMANDEGHGFAKKNNADYLFYATVAFVKEYLLK